MTNRRAENPSKNYSTSSKDSMAPSAYLLNKERQPREIANLERLQRERPMKPPAKRVKP